MLSLGLALLLLPALRVAGAQLPLGSVGGSPVDHPLGYISPESSSEAPIQTASLNALSSDDFASFSHPSYPAYGLRIKQSPSEFCDHTVKSYTGYLDVDYGTKHMFFYFFESRSDPDKDDVLMWINGGPGCSELYQYHFVPTLRLLKHSDVDQALPSACLWNSGESIVSDTDLNRIAHDVCYSWDLFRPCSVENPLAKGFNGTKWNPHSWNSNTNLFFLDQPYVSVSFLLSFLVLLLTVHYRVDVGFSYADFGPTVGTTEEAAIHVDAFVRLFFETFSQFKGRAFHMSGTLSNLPSSIMNGFTKTVFTTFPRTVGESYGVSIQISPIVAQTSIRLGTTH